MIKARRLGDVDYVAELGARDLFLTLAVLRFGGDQRLSSLRHNATVMAPRRQDCATPNRDACICTLGYARYVHA